MAENLYFAGEGRDLPYMLAEVALASSRQVADAIVSASRTTAWPRADRVAV